jgi:hypothetical protein
MTSTSRAQRKRKQAEQFSPMHPEEEKELAEALSISLRVIPGNGNVSEDDVDETDNQESKREQEEDDDEEQKGDGYEIKWGDIQQAITLNEFNQLSGPTKVLAGSKENLESYL